MLGFTIFCLVLDRARSVRNDDDCFLHGIPASLSHREKEAYRDLKNRCAQWAIENLIVKHPLGVTGVDAELTVGVIMTDGGAGGDGEGGS